MCIRDRIKALHPGTLFNIYRFGSHYEHLFDGSKTYDEQRMREALKYLRACKADLGGTEMLAPLKEIYRDRVPDGQFRDIVLITDGQISNEFAIAGLAKEHAGRTALHAVGIGYGPNEFLIKDTARASGGASALIAPKERIEPKVLSLFKKVMDGPIRDIKVSWGGVVEQAPREVVAFSGQVTSIFARGAADVSIESMVKITGQTRSGVKTWELPLDPVGEGVPIPLLWARERIVDIEDGNMGGSLQQVRRQKKATKEIIAISKQYGIVSSKTSYVGIEKRSATDQTTAKMALRKVPAMLTKGWGGLFDARVPYYSGVAYSITAASLGANVMPLFYKRSPFPPEMYCLEKVRKIGLDKAEVDKGDFLLNLLACQQADGGFIIADNLLKMVELSDLPSIADRIAIKDTGDKKLLLMTLMTLLLLEMYYETRRSLWEGIVRKSRAWLKREMKRMQPTIDGQPLDQWLVNYLENHEGLKRLA
ncbi:MAG: hypothetical protein N2Z74_03750 [Syntrophales bacterium]|nr:hypothetical protein [Syntrophales bacterium]